LVIGGGDPFKGLQSAALLADGLPSHPYARSSQLEPTPSIPQRRTPHQATQTRDHSIASLNARQGCGHELVSSGQQGHSDMTTYKGNCFCGAVEIEAQGDPEGMGYCHCSSCRSWSAAPVNAFTLWKAQNIRVTRGAELIGKFVKTEMSQRQYCRRCGGHLMTDHPPLGLVDVYAATIPTLKFVPGVHVNYSETVLPMKDGLPKLKDFPAELGGSGVAVPE